VKREFPDVTFVLAGDGKIPEHCRSVVDAHPETFEVHDYFIPNDEVKDHFGRASAVVLPYREQNGTKGHSGALATAFSFGRPVVATTAGEFPELVEESGAGATVPPDDPERLAAAIADVLAAADLREEMAANSRRMADRLSWDSIGERHVELYEDLRRSERAPAIRRP
jgi:glycosyltransferase involved in cell wall biosynthesis